MAEIPKSVVIVGGSLAGLFHGLYLKRHGSNVVILEQDPRAVRSGHQAGIAFGPAVKRLLAECDDTGVQSCMPGVSTTLTFGKRGRAKELRVQRHLTGWGLLYRILRANFDGLASEAVPDPPPPRPGDGRAEYLSGKGVTALRQNDDGTVTVTFTSAEDEVSSSLTADMVIGADGVNSTVRTLLLQPAAADPGPPSPGAGTQQPRTYAGYVSWRGTVPESALRATTAAQLAARMTLHFAPRTYLVSYAIPPDSGTFREGARLINWVWYVNLEAESPALADALTDATGRAHGTTVPAGLVRSEVWQRQLATHLHAMPPAAAELVAATPPENVFVTKVSDALAGRASFCEGRVLLVGDALAAFRPHFAVATEQAAQHCLDLGRVWRGEGTMEEWEREAVKYGERVWLESRLLGMAGLGRWWELARTLAAYVWFRMAV